MKMSNILNSRMSTVQEINKRVRERYKRERTMMTWVGVSYLNSDEDVIKMRMRRRSRDFYHLIYFTNLSHYIRVNRSGRRSKER